MQRRPTTPFALPARLFCLIVSLALSVLWSLPTAAETQRTARLDLGRGSDTRLVDDILTGDERIVYLITADRGDQLDIRMDAANADLFFVVTGPGRTGVLHLGATDGRRFRADLPVAGDYQLLVQAQNGSLGPNQRAGFRLLMRRVMAERPTDGPKEWQVTGVPNNLALPLRNLPRVLAGSTGFVRNGDILRNLGCIGRGTDKWCEVEVKKPRATGWVQAAYLRLPQKADPTPPAGNGPQIDLSGITYCQPDPSKPKMACSFNVAYGDRRGTARVWILTGHGTQRLIRFENALPVSSDGRGQLSYQIKGQTMTIKVGRELFELQQDVLRRK